MTPIYLAIIILLVGGIAMYAKFVRREELRHLAAERDSEKQHAIDWKEMATALADGALTWRELPTTQDAKLHAQMLGDTPEEREQTLEEMEAELREVSDPLNVSYEGELGRRRKLVHDIAMKRQNMDLAEKSEPLTGDYVNSLDPADVAHLEGRAS
jgi:hypothetical protein